VVQGTIKWLNPTIDIMRRRKQGSTDPESAWAVARFNWMQQLLVQFEIIKLTTNNDVVNRNLPSFCIHQITFWDEMHKEQIVGMVGNQLYHFSCDADGKYDPWGMIVGEIGSQLHMK